MPTFLPQDDLELHKTFETILSIENFSDCINEIVELIHTNKFYRPHLDRILKDNHIKQIENIKEKLLDVMLVYINLILNDNVITTNEAGNLKFLKRVFKIKEGDFYNYRYDEVKEILNRQFEPIYFDNQIDIEEALLRWDFTNFLI